LKLVQCFDGTASADPASFMPKQIYESCLDVGDGMPSLNPQMNFSVLLRYGHEILAEQAFVVPIHLAFTTSHDQNLSPKASVSRYRPNKSRPLSDLVTDERKIFMISVQILEYNGFEET
jgi:hypothetical protein